MDRGSRKHVLDWTGRPSFLAEFESLLSPIPVKVPPDAAFMPRGDAEPEEARLERFGPSLWSDSPAWGRLQDWWLVHRRGANTPNWDIASSCEIEGRPGLVLVEAKANWPELGLAGKRLANDASPSSVENHERIGAAIDEARAAWQHIDSAVMISRDTHYQLSNRIAFAWKLATLGIPVVLVYLGFTGDEGIRDAGAPFADDADWRKAFAEYSAGAVPTELLETRHEFDAVPVWIAVRSREVMEDSQPCFLACASRRTREPE